jgi:hypothetical protein
MALKVFEVASLWYSHTESSIASPELTFPRSDWAGPFQEELRSLLSAQ